jgi:enoyl-CoA hydratase/carnithine racemase
LLTARLMSADEAFSAGFLAALADDLDRAAETIIERVLGHAPLTMWAAKEALRRLNRNGGGADVTDIVSRVYGSADFQNAVKAFMAKRAPGWGDHRAWASSDIESS